MAKKTFAIVLNGIEVKTLEELRENFNLEEVITYFKSGELLNWLVDRFYDDEADAIEKISADDKNLTHKLCAALDVECDEDLEFNTRVREKKEILESMTNDQNVIGNAQTTALNQDDLANLLHMGYSTIYLCGESFSVPIRVADKKYIGVLSTPKIKIKADSQEDLDAKNLVFENCKLPFMKETPVEAMKALVAKIFRTNGEWQVVNRYNKVTATYDELTKEQKIIALHVCCQRKYKESEIIFLMIRDDFSDGFALTVDSFCTGGASGKNFVKYSDIREIDERCFSIETKHGEIAFSEYTKFGNRVISVGKRIGMLSKSGSNVFARVKEFLDVAKNF